ncbi:SCP-like extracellular protein [Colletotrichum navitas]|uniref:SCP-like extracellular protein n=1 Tax=Colletotrichum navitas TaxID=681940 RepID=A0AAD8PPG1_9PEZI|nr:SCP-like extracellular protein [Colletotrichum navitas]KAK1573999.1 SCP-like extracellular protein [Colletotrichum navitas]
MKSSVVLAATGAVMAMGAALDPRVMKTMLDITFVTVTVTDGMEPTPSPTSSTPAVFYEAPVSVPKVEQSPEPAPAPVFQTIIISNTPEPTPTPTPTPTPEPVVAPVVPSPPPAKPVVVETAPAAPSPAPVADDLESTCIDTHNLHRANHSAPALSWDSQLASYALITAKTCVFEHDMSEGGGGYGQNLAMWGATGSENLGEAKAAQRAITDQWYNGEINLYPGYGLPNLDMSNFLSWGHFSQLVWVDSTTVGCAVNYCAAGTLSSIGSWFTVCNYKSQGNVIGSFAQNVLPPRDAASVYVA